MWNILNKVKSGPAKLWDVLPGTLQLWLAVAGVILAILAALFTFAMLFALALKTGTWGVVTFLFVLAVTVITYVIKWLEA